MVQSILHLVKLQLVILSVNNYNQHSETDYRLCNWCTLTSD